MNTSERAVDESSDEPLKVGALQQRPSRPLLIPYEETLHRRWRHCPETLSDLGFFQANADIAKACIVSLLNHLAGRPAADAPRNLPSTPFYVRWTDANNHERGLYVSRFPECMSTTLWTAAIMGACRVEHPMSLEEIQNSKCEVGVMFDYAEAGAWDDWKAHTHGVLAEFKDGRAWSYACVLPGVGGTPEKKTKKQWIAEAVRRAGYTEALDDDFFDRLRVTRFRVASCSAKLS